MRRLAAGLLSGAAGTAAVAAFGRLREAGATEPVYAPERIAARLLGTRRAALPLRTAYGTALGLAWSLGLGRTGLRFPWSGLAAGLGTFLLELVAMPATGATPPLRRWGRGEVPALAAQTLLFGLAALGLRSLLAERT